MKIFNELFNLEEKNVALKGMTDEAFCIYVNNQFNNNSRGIIVVTNTLFEANKLYNTLSVLNNDTLLFPMDDFLTSQAISISPDLMISRLETLNELVKNNNKIVVTHLMGALRYLPSKEDYKNNTFNLKVGDDYKINDLIDTLIKLGYNKDSIVSKTGDIAVRGFLFDIFPIGENNPIRIEFFGDTIDSIRSFDMDTQKSIEEIKEITIYPANESTIKDNEEIINKELYKYECSSIIDYINDPIIFIKDYQQIKAEYNNTQKQIKEYKDEKDKDYSGNYMHNLSILDANNANHYLVKDSYYSDIKFNNIIDFKIKEVPKFYENMEMIEGYFQKNKNKTIIICLKKNQINAFSRNIENPYIITNINEIKKNVINLVEFELQNGFEYEDYIFLTSYNLFNYQESKKKFKTKFKYSTKIKDINKLEVGDYIVHQAHGIGIYNGIKSLDVLGMKKDFIELIYKNNDKLYIPVEKIDTISKYSGKEGIAPKIYSLGGSDWKKTKIQISNKVHNIAKELINIYAERKIKQGFKFNKDDELQAMFENEFEYECTPDQITSLQQIKSDMESSNPMDRLLCGDVGFGKTEVAFRAIFKAIESNKQVIYLCPTTILSMQQYESALNRFKNFPINIGLLNRFVSTKKCNENIKNFNEGKIDLLIGTHKVLNDKIKPKDLGLLVIDEEQRFGVTHKEKIKKYKSDVDVLTLTATPIPRTLQMSLVGIRSLSLISTPPTNRYPVQTYVLEESNQLIKEAIYKELSRSGQVFILYNNITDIEKKVYEIQKLVPEAKIIYAHGRMDKNDIEDKMHDFIKHEADIMVCTTIIETGIDIPNVNTLIVLDADRFGLSQLYQLRGRVGRSDRIAYSYMMYRPNKVLNDAAIKRLKAIEDFTELGSGFKIANRDLSIRGAGDILGSEQAGFIDSVGIDLYLQILNDEVRRIRGEEVEEENTSDKALINVSTHIDDKYVDDTDLKIEIHRLINTIDSYDTLEKVRKEIEDRFGKINTDMEIYMYEEWFERIAQRLCITTVNQSKLNIELVFSEEKSKKIDAQKLFIESYRVNKAFKLGVKNNCITVTLPFLHLEKHYIYYLVELLSKME